MMTERDQSWNSSEHSVSYFDHVEQATKQLIKAGIDSDNSMITHLLLSRSVEILTKSLIIGTRSQQRIKHEMSSRSLWLWNTPKWSSRQTKGDKTAGFGTAANLVEAKPSLQEYATNAKLVTAVTNASTQKIETSKQQMVETDHQMHSNCTYRYLCHGPNACTVAGIEAQRQMKALWGAEASQWV